MSEMIITFQCLVQDSQDYGSDDEHMISRAFFSVDFEDNTQADCSVDIKQVVGSNIETTPLEVSNLQGYAGPMDTQALRESAENYFRSLVGSSGSGIRIAGTSNVKMRENIFEAQRAYKFDVDPRTGGAGW